MLKERLAKKIIEVCKQVLRGYNILDASKKLDMEPSMLWTLYYNDDWGFDKALSIAEKLDLEIDIDVRVKRAKKFYRTFDSEGNND